MSPIGLVAAVAGLLVGLSAWSWKFSELSPFLGESSFPDPRLCTVLLCPSVVGDHLGGFDTNQVFAVACVGFLLGAVVLVWDESRRS